MSCARAHGSQSATRRTAHRATRPPFAAMTAPATAQTRAVCRAVDGELRLHADRLAPVTSDPTTAARRTYSYLGPGRHLHRGGARAGARGARPALALGAQRRRGARRRRRGPVGCRDDRDRELGRRRRLDRAGRARHDARPADRRRVPRARSTSCSSPAPARRSTTCRSSPRTRSPTRSACSGSTRTLPAHAHIPASSNVASAIGPPRRHERCGCRDRAARHPRAPRPRRCSPRRSATTRTRSPGSCSSRRTVAPPAPTGADKTSLIAELPDDHPGALLEMLEQFATRGINLSLLASRPIGDALGRYRFVIDADGHIEDERMADALLGPAPLQPEGRLPRLVPARRPRDRALPRALLRRRVRRGARLAARPAQRRARGLTARRASSARAQAASSSSVCSAAGSRHPSARRRTRRRRARS